MSRNRVQCNSCKSIIESTSQHHFVSCSCGKCSVDGGSGWGGRVIGDPTNMTFMPTDDPVENAIYTQDSINQYLKHVEKQNHLKQK